MRIDKLAAVATVVLVAVILRTPARAAVIIDITEVGSNVVITGSGTVDLTDLTYAGSGSGGGSLAASEELFLGPVAQFWAYSGISGPASFGVDSSDGYAESSGSGDSFGLTLINFNTVSNLLWLPLSYVSGSVLSASATYDDETFDSLGLITGSFAYAWGAGPHADSLTLNIGTIPEPASLALMGTALIGLRASRRRGW